MWARLRERLTYYFSPAPQEPPSYPQPRHPSVTDPGRQDSQSLVRKVKSGRVVRSAHLTKQGGRRYRESLSSTKDNPLTQHNSSKALDNKDNIAKTEATKSKEDKPLNKTASRSDRKDRITALLGGLNEDEDDEDLPPLLPEEKAEFFPDLGKEREIRASELATVADATWTQAERDLYNKLNLRGFEPLVPNTWRLDFKTFPEILFSRNMDEVFFTAESGRLYQATRALNKLINLGVRVRDRLLTDYPPEPTIRREIDNYIKWSYTDGDLIRRDFIPALVVETKSPKEPVASVVGRMTTKLHSLGRRYRQKYGTRSEPKSANNVWKGKSRAMPEHPVSAEPNHDLLSPTLYGLIIAETIVTFITYDASVPDKAIRPLQIFDFGNSSQDVWNGLAVGILVVWVRNFLMTQEAEIVDQDEESDPDA